MKEALCSVELSIFLWSNSSFEHQHHTLFEHWDISFHIWIHIRIIRFYQTKRALSGTALPLVRYMNCNRCLGLFNLVMSECDGNLRDVIWDWKVSLLLKIKHLLWTALCIKTCIHYWQHNHSLWTPLYIYIYIHIILWHRGRGHSFSGHYG